ncbi:MAG: alkyl hydroperoxide reductase/Thiol specific antioxidant/Mal allergen [bacterium]|nr:alkyl hydroperoxide reductase/Thiol specific antioxidant/Mal allergen [bacterium]
MLAPGDRAPAFKLEGDDGKTHTLKEFSGKTLILYFYPRDNTPGCSTQACDLRDEAAAFKKKNAVVVGVSPDSIASHGKFRDKFNLNFLLLADPDHAIAEAYGAWGDKVLYGKQYRGIIRSTFVIDEKGKIVSALYKVSPKGHASAILEAL